jgi:hypothetical protein
MIADTIDIGIPSANRYSIRAGVCRRSSSGTGLTTGHHISTATAMNMICCRICASCSTSAQLYAAGKCQPMNVTL